MLKADHQPHPRAAGVVEGVNVNWLLITGLEDVGYQEEAKRLEERTLELVFENGFWEYYDPRTGQGLGCSQFSWTAAAVLDLCRR